MQKKMSLKHKRGIVSIDLNQILVFVKAPIESVAQTFSQAIQAEIWERDVYQREIEIVGQGFIVFQFREHSWTVIKQVNFLPYGISLGTKDAQNFSRLLSTRAIYYKVSDTSGYIGYDFYEKGALRETLYFEEEMSFQFQSQLRQLEAEDIEDPYNFTFDFILEQDIYIPPIHRVVSHQGILRLLGPGLENLEPNDFERLDYIATLKGNSD
jgi:hypothetical protein